MTKASITSPDATQLNSIKQFCWVESLNWSHRPIRPNSTELFCRVESRRAMRSRLKSSRKSSTGTTTIFIFIWKMLFAISRRMNSRLVSRLRWPRSLCSSRRVAPAINQIVTFDKETGSRVSTEDWRPPNIRRACTSEGSFSFGLSRSTVIESSDEYVSARRCLASQRGHHSSDDGSRALRPGADFSHSFTTEWKNAMRMSRLIWELKWAWITRTVYAITVYGA